MEQRFVAGYEDFDAVFFGCAQEIAVFESGPASLTDGENLMCAKVVAQAVRKIFVEQHLHGWACPRYA